MIMQKKWRRVSSKVILSHPRVMVREYVHFHLARAGVTIIAIDANGRILIQKEYSYPPDEWLYQLPGGGAHEGESIEEAAARELAEESSLGGRLQEIGWFFADNRKRQDKMHVFIARDLYEKKAEGDPEEVIETHWFSKKEVASMVASGQIVNHSLLAAWAIFRESPHFKEQR